MIPIKRTATNIRASYEHRTEVMGISLPRLSVFDGRLQHTHAPEPFELDRQPLIAVYFVVINSFY
jgi:hypothetical protein